MTAYDPTWEEENVFFCPFDVRPRGFPAVDPSGSAVVTARVEVSGGSEGEDAILALRWLDAATGEVTRRVEIYDAADLERAATDAVDPCAAYRETVARRARRISRELRRGGWRPMRALDVHIAADGGEELPQDRVDLLAIPAASRPLEVLWRDAAFVARVPRVKLFVEEPADWYGAAETNRDDMACEADPRLERVYGDRRAGLLAIEYRNDSPHTSCLCDVRTETGLIAAPDALFERLASAR
ncbi:MAG: hypothetical protein KC486_17880 [Myxococcales bacterium]|nr:hypothetical protein [Myxococcales bacterium]